MKSLKILYTVFLLTSHSLLYAQNSSIPSSADFLEITAIPSIFGESKDSSAIIIINQTYDAATSKPTAINHKILNGLYENADISILYSHQISSTGNGMQSYNLIVYKVTFMKERNLKLYRSQFSNLPKTYSSGGGGPTRLDLSELVLTVAEK